MKIVIIRLNVGDFGKIGTYNVQEIGLANALIKKGNEVDVIYLNRNVNSIIRDEVYDYVYYLPHISLGLHGIFDLKLLDKFKPEQIILFSDNQFWAKNVILWCKRNNVRIIHYFGNVLSDNKKWINQFYTKLILKRNIKSYNYSVNVAKTEKVHEEMERLKVPFTKVIPVGLDDSVLMDKRNLDVNIRNELGFRNDEIVLLFIGRLVNYKRPILACDIAKALIKKGKKVRLVIIGKGVLKEKLLRHITENELTNVVNYIEGVPYSDIYKYMVSCDCLINLSSKEIFGMTILEAMYYGLPVVAHTAPGPNEIIDDGITGYLCDSNNIETWLSFIEKAINNRDILGAESKKQIMTRFVWEKIASRFLELL